MIYSYNKEIDTVARQYPAEPFRFLEPALILRFSEGVKMLRDAGVEMSETDDLR